MSAFAKLIEKHRGKCKELYDLLQNTNGIDSNTMSTSNWICHNAETQQFHQEKDSSYTIINVPYWDNANNEINDDCKREFRSTKRSKVSEQSSMFKHSKMSKTENKNISRAQVNFEFQWTSQLETDNDSKKYLSLQMHDGLTLFYSGFACYHRQHCRKKGEFWNLSCYQNKRFFDNMKKSIERSIEDVEK